MSAKYVVAMCGDLNRGERMNCAVLAWDPSLGVDAPVTVHMTQGWPRIRSAFWPSHAGWTTNDLQDDITKRITGIKTLGDLRTVVEKSGPYTPFEFTEERGSTESPEATAESMAEWFLHQEKGRKKTDEGSGNG